MLSTPEPSITIPFLHVTLYSLATLKSDSINTQRGQPRSALHCFHLGKLWQQGAKKEALLKLPGTRTGD